MEGRLGLRSGYKTGRQSQWLWNTNRLLPWLPVSPSLNAVPYFRQIHSERMFSNLLSNRPNENDIFDIHETSLIWGERLWPLTQLL